ncbi:MAG: response regulator transcription factor [Cyclobacteriaceae bacterium]|nr:MAG: response regulator transcription factor [Cyclobacteriaceae bacterium]
MPVRTSILVADDHALVRKGVITFLKVTKVASKFYEAANGNEVINLAKKYPIDLFLLDISMPELNGYETAKILLEQNKHTRIIVNTMFDGHALVNGLVQLGVKGFVTKGDDPETLVKAIQAVMKGRTYICPKMREHINLKNEGALDFDFSETELRLVELLSQGYSSEEIAEELEISVRTAETYRHRLIKRLNVSNSIELVEYFHRNGLLRVES